MANREVLFIDGVRTPFGRAGEKGMYWKTRADDLAVKAIKGLLDRNPQIPHDRTTTSPSPRPLSKATRG